MVDKFQTILSRVEREKGEISLLALLKMDDITNKWSVLFSAAWITEANFRDSFIYLMNLIIETLSEEERSTIARIGILPLHDHLVQELLKYKTGTKLSGSQRMNGNIVHEAEIIKSSESIIPQT